MKRIYGWLMLDFLLQLFGLFLLLVGLAIGYRLWIRPHNDILNFQSRGLLLLILLTLMGGFVGSPFWWGDEARSFSWNTPALVSRMLASAGWSFVVVSFLALRRPSHRRLRLVLILLFVYLFPLTIAILLFHLDRFDFSAPITYAFFAIVILMDIASLWYLIRQPTILPDESQDTELTSRILRLWMVFVAVLLGLWGLALFVTNTGPIKAVWVWKYDVLSTRLIGVMLLAIAAGLVYSLRQRDVAQVMLATTVTYGLGISAASLWNLVTGRSLPVSYLVTFAVVSLVSILFLLANRGKVPIL
ncbi:MAG: hypothetical protein R3300_22670 [Candidatus Promineifilaceae bacterium]|nr:hypothetical protein [Candidatus Promineifilaceae bacterium]